MSKSSPLAKRKMIDPCPECEGQGSFGVLRPCQACDGSGAAAIVCRSCWNKQPPAAFQRRDRSGFSKTCKSCRDRYRIGEKNDHRKGLPDAGPMRVKLNVVSGNVKTGEVPVSMTSSPSCPTSCAHRNGACYAERHFVGMHWRRLSAGAGMTWDDFCEKIAALPEGQVWRHNEAGDLPGEGDEIDDAQLQQLVEANRGRNGFTYTHKQVLELSGVSVGNRLAVLEANENGFTINLSADNLEHADMLADLWIGPVSVVLPENAPRKLETPAGRIVIVCPAQWSQATCDSCRLCAKPQRKAIIGFWAHGPGKGRIVSSLQLPLF